MSSTTPRSSAGTSVGHALEQLLTGVEPRQPQQVLDQPLHARRMALDDLEEALPGVGVVGLVEQGLGVALDGGERRAQLVRDVGDEVAADLIGALEVGDVVQHEDRAAAGRDDRRQRGPPGRAAPSRLTASSKAWAGAAGQHLANCSAMPGWRIAST